MQNLIITILGKKGSGKSFLTKKLLPRFPKPVFVLDSQDEYKNGVIFQSYIDLRDYLVKRKINRSGIYVLRPESDDDVSSFFTLVYRLGSCSVIIEEASLYCNPYRIDDGFKKIMNYGRHRQINLIAIARRGSELHRDITAQSDFIISFRQTEKRDLAILDTVDEKANQLNQLGQYKYIVLGDPPENNQIYLDIKSGID